VADTEHIYVVGRANLFALEQKSAYVARKKARAARARKRAPKKG
jgi:hypothetical protein